MPNSGQAIYSFTRKKNVGSLEIHDIFSAEQAICPHEKKNLGSDDVRKFLENLKIVLGHSPALSLPYKYDFLGSQR